MKKSIFLSSVFLIFVVLLVNIIIAQDIMVTTQSNTGFEQVTAHSDTRDKSDCENTPPCTAGFDVGVDENGCIIWDCPDRPSFTTTKDIVINNTNVANIERYYCTEDELHDNVCAETHRPVCGYYMGGEDECSSGICMKTFSNKCFACQDMKVGFVISGECEVLNINKNIKAYKKNAETMKADARNQIEEMKREVERIQSEIDSMRKEVKRVREEIRDGAYEVKGEIVRIREEIKGLKELEVNGIRAHTRLNITADFDENNNSAFKAHLRNGREFDVKVMPDVASQRALERLRLKVCNPEKNCTIELKEVGVGGDAKAMYEVQLERHSRILGIFAKKMQVKAEVNAENGEVMNVEKPWWAFIATEPAE